MGALGAGLVRLFWKDHLFKAFVESYIPLGNHFDNPTLYLPYTVVFAAAAVIAIAIYLFEILNRGFRSWIRGVTSGLCLLSFCSMFIVLTLDRGSPWHQLFVDLVIVVVCFALGYLLHVSARVRAAHTLTEEQIRVPPQVKSLGGAEMNESDDPIQSWRQDVLNRASLIESISRKLLIAKSPVLALFGEFGSGKSSALNLLREHLGGKAIVVSFSTWLPGSQETLTAYLLADIASQCQKHYVVPGLSKSARRLASALAQTVPILKGYSELYPAPTQRDDIESMRAALARLPKRVVVLLDEIDRMEKEELVTLLKVIRGVSSLPNLSFVCAAERETLIKTARGKVDDESNRYFEKFFPVSIPIPNVDQNALRTAGTERLIEALRRRDWFDNESEEESYRRQIDDLWTEQIAPFCRNLRAIGLLANNVGTAAALLRREVHPVDLTLVELLRRFKPSVYDLIGRNSEVLTGGEGWTKGATYRSDKEKEAWGKRVAAEIRKLAGGDEDAETVERILHELFPKFDAIAGTFRFGDNRKVGEEEKRIAHPGMFAAYFRYELPDAIFSSIELERFLREFKTASTSDERKRIFLEELDSMQKGAPKRTDFLMKLSDAAKSMDVNSGRNLAFAAMIGADRYVYDGMFIFHAEGGFALRIVIRVAEKIPTEERVSLLSQCISDATDDTMAFRILTYLTRKDLDFNLSVSLEQVYSSFAERMRRLYGPHVDAWNADLSTSDKDAFNLWGHHDPEDKSTEHDFWLRYIGDSRSRLARIFQGIFMPVSIYTSDPAIFVENKISLSDLRRLYESLQDEKEMTDSDRVSLRRLKRLLDGEFKNGIDYHQLEDRPEEENRSGSTV
jgi:hypothetical protein